MSNSRRVLLVVALALYAVLVFVLDVVTPLGIDAWVLNLPLILVPVLFRNIRMVVYLTVVCSAMVALGWLGSPPGSNPAWWDLLNRAMGLATITPIAFLAINFIKKTRQLDGALGRLRQEVAERALISQALEESEQRLRLAVEGAGMATFDVNLRTGKVDCSATLLRILGYETMAGHETSIDLWRSRIHPDDLVRVLEAGEQALRDRSAYSLEYRIKRADNGRMVWLAVYGRYFFDESGKGVRFLGVAFDITRRKELERESVEHEVLAITAREQRQIGQEMHDGVGQELTGLGLMAQSLAERLPQGTLEKKIAVRLLEGLDSIHQQVRELSRGLIPVHVESRGLAAALDDLAARTTEASGISVTAECPEWVELPDHATATELFRIAQEAVANAVRHGRPEHVRLSLLTEPNSLELQIRDDGLGIQGGPDECDGLGLRIMHYRARQIGGVLQIGPMQGGGTVVSCTVPGSNGKNGKECGSSLDQGEGSDRG
jgi:PAS domain S-box-containing protein